MSQGEITVIQPAVEEEKVLSKEEREAQFKELSARTKIPLVYFDNIAKLEDAAAAKEALAVKPEIPGLLMRKLLDFGGVTAVVKTFPQHYLNIESIRTEFHVPPRKMGQAEVKKPPKPIKSAKAAGKKVKLPKERKVSPGAQAKAEEQGIVADYVVNTQLTKSHNVYFLTDIIKHNAKAPLFRAGFELLDICGVVLDPHAAVEQYYIQGVPGNMPYRSRMQSGNYNEQYLWSQIFSPFLNSEAMRGNFMQLMPLAKSFGHSKVLILFKDEASTMKICRAIIDLQIYLKNYVLHDYIPRILKHAFDLAQSPDEKILKEISALHRALVATFRIPEENPVKEMPPDEKPLGDKTKSLQTSLVEVEKLTPGKFSYRFPDSVWFDISSLGMWQFFEKLFYLATNKDMTKEQKNSYEKEVADTMARLEVVRQAAAQRMVAERRMQDKIYQEKIYRHIYIQKFGYERFLEIQQKMPKYGTMKATILSQETPILEYLGKKEREIVELEYRNVEKFFQAMEENDAPWMKLVHQMRNTKNKEQELKFYKELRKYLPTGPKQTAKNANDWLRSKEGFPILCPHMRDKMELELAGKKPGEIRDFILDYAGETPLFQAYYCRICGEVITHSDEMEGIVMFEGDQVVVLHNVEDALKDFIWKQTNQVVCNYIEFKELKTNKFVNQLINSMVRNLYDFINLIDKKLRKSKTSSIEEVENKLKLYTSIYVYAMLIKIILDNPAKIRFAGMNYGASESKSEKSKMAKKLFDYALDKIVSTQNIILNTLPDINEEFIQSKLLQAHKNIETLLTKSKLEGPAPTDVVLDLLLDPVYLYLARVAMLHELDRKHFGDVGAFAKRLEDVTRPQHLFGQDPNKIARDAKSEHIYEHVKVPQPKKELSTQFYELANPKKLAKDARIKKQGATREEFLQDFYVGYFWESYRLFMQYVQERSYMHPVFRVKIEKSPDNENLFLIDSKLDDHLQKYEKDTAPLRAAAAVLMDLRKYYHMAAYSKFPYRSGLLYQGGHESSLDLSRRYGYEFNTKFDIKAVNGLNAEKVSKKSHFHVHNWNIVAYTDLAHYQLGKTIYDYKGKLQYYTEKAVKELVSKPEYLNMTRVDVICSECFHPYQGIEEVVKDPQKLLDEDQHVTNFFNFYENRCPKAPKDGDLFHEFRTDKKTGEEECRNCGLTKAMVLDHDEDFYKKYSAQFDKATTVVESSESMRESLPIGFSSESAMKSLEMKVPEPIRKWKYNANIVNEMVSKTFDVFQKSGKVKKTEYFNMLNNLGLTERLEYDRVMSGAETPYKDMEKSKPLTYSRINRLSIYIAELISDYHIMQNYKNLPTVPLDIKNILGLATGGLGKIDQIVTMYPAPDSKFTYYDWSKYIRYLYFVDDPKQMAHFLLECFYTILLNVLVHLTKKVNIKFAEAFVGYFLNKIINMERNVSKMKEQRAASIEAGQKIATTDDPNMQDHGQSREFDSDAALADDKFSYEGMDYEGENEEYNT